MFTTLVYDLDDTLYPEKQFAFSGFEAVDTWFHREHGIVGFAYVARQVFESGVRGTIFNAVLEKLGVDVSDSLIDEMVKIYREHTPQIQLFPEVLEVIQHFHSEKNQAIITDGVLHVQQNKVKILGLADAIPFILYTDALGREYWKPNPLPYEKIMEHFNVEGSECIYVGDNPKKDFVAAKKLDWYTFRVKREGGEYAHLASDSEYDAHRHITSLLELKDLID